MLTPLDINKKEFHRTFRGYSCEEVDEFLEQVLRDFGQIYRENQELREKNLRLGGELERYARLEQTLKDALVMAQQTADEMRQNAQREAALIIQEAENKAREILNQARLQVEKAERYRSDLEAKTAAFKMRLRSFLQAQLEILATEEEAAPASYDGLTGEEEISEGV
ncbi:DivIVA domain-containing protein [Moorella sulfitireducens (nom. illeg.)]|uniref:DivIVA domain-containing protein n=1 Tax=Neomoorella sulfitireducens TaxID=2972948 RepID=UPI0021ACF324